MASSVFIVHSLPLFTNWFTLWTARCDGPQMWLHIPAFGAYVISFNSSISWRSGFSPAPFVCVGLPHPLFLYLPTWSLIPATPVLFLTGLPSCTKANIHPITKQGKFVCWVTWSHFGRFGVLKVNITGLSTNTGQQGQLEACMMRKLWAFTSELKTCGTMRAQYSCCLEKGLKREAVLFVFIFEAFWFLL